MENIQKIPVKYLQASLSYKISLRLFLYYPMYQGFVILLADFVKLQNEIMCFPFVTKK